MRTRQKGRAGVLTRLLCLSLAPDPDRGRVIPSQERVVSARHCVRLRRDSRVCGCRVGRPGGGEAVIAFDIIAVALAVGALVYLVFALVKPEKF
ncbi:potassium-transporting ATPase subunit F [Conyzicola sp.]|uniref:potassium-transporting ATPase subunit F n=1 Tax=Conyzicola sp. TaxID=1969404 RepID=UPI0039899FBF